MPEFEIDGQTVVAEDYRDGVLINPVLPEGFEQCSNHYRPEEHLPFYYRPFIISAEGGYRVRCLDGGAHDRSSSWGRVSTLSEAFALAKSRDPYQYAGIGLPVLRHRGMPIPELEITTFDANRQIVTKLRTEDEIWIEP